MKEFEILEAIESVSGSKEKNSLLKDNNNNERLGELLDAALNVYRRFNIHKFELPDPVHSADDKHDEFVEILSKLELQILKGNEARDHVESFFSRCNEQQQYWYRKVIDKNLNIGVSAKSVSSYFDIPNFELMLATNGKNCSKLHDIVEKGVYVSPKLDGYRCIAVIKNGTVNLLSRNGKPYTNFPRVEQSLSKSFPEGTYIFDGEMMSDDFNAMQKSAFANKRGTTVGDMKFWVFDYIPSDEWFSDKFNTTKSERCDNLLEVSKYFDDDIVKIVDNDYINSIEEVLKLEDEFVKAGFEGAIAVPDIPYYKGKKKNKMLKFKPHETQDCVVIDFYEGTKYTKNEGKMGGIVVRQENDEICECGIGFSDDDREYMWNNKHEFINKIAEIEYDALTKDGIMRFPRFLRWREDKE